jgi:two-component system NtrC family sensor kinase
MGVIFKVASGNVLMFFLLGFLALLFLNVFVLYYFSKSLADEISLVAENLTEIAEGENVDLDRKLAVISNDELGDLVVAFNKIQQKEKEHICELEEKQAIIIEREQLAQDTLKKLKQLQMQLINQEKLAGIGQLAAGVAHEINTPLGYVSSNIETLKNYIMNYRTMLDTYRNFYKEVCKLYPNQSIPGMNTVYNTENKINIDFINSDITDLFNDVSDGLERISKIVMGLRTFSRVDQQNEFEEYDLNNGIQNTLLVANNEIKYHAKVELFLGDIPNIYANGGQINQVLLNIIINAVHATKSKEDINSSLITVRTYSDERYASCEIEDNGTGIPGNIIGRIFDPFYTTKPVGQGTGLGLSIAYDIIVNKHKGELLVDSKPDAGSKFTVRLPVHR